MRRALAALAARRGISLDRIFQTIRRRLHASEAKGSRLNHVQLYKKVAGALPLRAILFAVGVSVPLLDNAIENDYSLLSYTREHVAACDDDKNSARSVDAEDTIPYLQTLEGLFDIYEDIGCGGYGTVKRAFDRRLQKVVSLKIMPKADTTRRDVMSEVKVQRIAGAHENVNALLGMFETKTDWIIELEYLSGGELFDRLVDRGTYSEREASQSIRSIAAAIKFLHAQGIVHGDIKPENIMLSDESENARLELIDFGMAFAEGDDEGRVEFSRHGVTNDAAIASPGSALASKGSLESGNANSKKQRTKSRLVIHQRLTELHLGTTAYAPNEVLMCDKSKIGSPIDMWALGILIYILLSGVHPFDPNNDATDLEIERRIKANEYNFDDPVWNNVSSSAIELIRLLLSHNMEDRPTIDEALAHPWLADRNLHLLSNEPLPELVAENLRKYQRGRRRLRASILAVLLGLQKKVKHQADRLITYMSPNSAPSMPTEIFPVGVKKDDSNPKPGGSRAIPTTTKQSVSVAKSSREYDLAENQDETGYRDEGSNAMKPAGGVFRENSIDNVSIDENATPKPSQKISHAENVDRMSKSPDLVAQESQKDFSTTPRGEDKRSDTGPATNNNHVFSRLEAFDLDRKGFISAEDLRRVSKDLGEELSEEEVGEMIHVSDEDSPNRDSESKGTHVRHSDIRRIIAGLRAQHFVDGDLISKEGDIERIFYLLLQGTVERSFLSATGRRIVVDHVVEGDHFGASELLRSDGEVEARSVTCRCISPACEILTFPQDDLAILTDVFANVGERLQKRAMVGTKDVLVRYITEAMPDVVEEEFLPGDAIVTQGEESDRLFVIVSGEVEVKSGTNDSVTVEWLGPGDFFPLGVAGILQSFSAGNKRRGATVRCVTPVRLVRVEGQSFRQFLKKSQIVYQSVETDVLHRLKKRNKKANIIEDDDDVLRQENIVDEEDDDH